MKIIICLSENNGFMFYNRRQTSDDLILEDIFKTLGKEKIYISKYTYNTYPNIKTSKINFEVIDANNLLSYKNIKNENWVFIEDFEIPEENINKLMIYFWNVDYPANKFFCIEELKKYKCINEEKLESEVHENITKKIYVKK